MSDQYNGIFHKPELPEWVKEAEEAKQLPNQRRATTKHLQKPNKK